MKEELITSGRMNHGIDPVLHAWGWEIATYLFLGGLAAGLIIYAAFYTLTNKDKKLFNTLKVAPMFVPIFLAIGLMALFIDLHHKLYFWRLYTTIRLNSPMSWGAWTLMLITPLSIIYAVLNLKTVFPKINTNHRCAKNLTCIIETNSSETQNWDWKYKWMQNLEKFFLKNFKVIIWMLLIFGIILGIYTGILLSAFNARPLWNTSALGMLFLVSGLSTAAAFIMLISKDHEEIKWFSKVDLLMIAIELFLIIHLFMGYLASTQAQVDAAHMFLGGQYTVAFWGFVVFLGLILPAFLEILELRGYKINPKIAAILILLGGLILRFVIVYGGQASQYVY
ncbi:MAG: NrfD/PsrC family molybdoenzyme membrane anchor subunit [Bacteroidota bacterium]